MKKLFAQVAHVLLAIIDFFYPPFRTVLPLQTFRYAASGGGNVVLGFLVYSLSYSCLFKGQPLVLVFSDSAIKGRIQLFRYLLVCFFNLVLNYLLLKLMVEQFNLFPLLAQVITVAIVVTFSYLAQRNFSFKAPAKLP
ncbi:MAG: GtrA family protein [Chitinophagia bacterium]|nr:GtrA family protein [Chitinophagia bacterium]